MVLEFLNPHDFMNRELSWLSFNDRIITLSKDINQPLLERANFLSIAQSNLDEWYMVRIANLIHAIENGEDDEDPSGMTPAEQLKMLRRAVKKHLKNLHKAYHNHLLPALSDEAIDILPYRQLSVEQQHLAEKFFRLNILPKLTPVFIHDKERWPLIENAAEQLLLTLKDSPRTLVNVALPKDLPALVRIDAQFATFVPLIDLLAEFAGQIVPTRRVAQAHSYRVLRDMQMDDLPRDTPDLATAIEEQVVARPFAPIINLTVSGNMPNGLKRRLARKLAVDPFYIFRGKGLLDYGVMRDLRVQIATSDVANLARLYYAPHEAYHEQDLLDDQIFTHIARKDYLLHHPYDSFDPVINFFVQAANDPLVSEVALSIYRVSDGSPLVAALKQAAQNGKRVIVLLEIKARFDEANNLQLVDELRQAGAEVYTSFPDLKVHAKMAYVMRDGQIFAHLGTGNYNDKTAHFYTDFGLFTARSALGEDVKAVFDFVTHKTDMPKELHAIKMAPTMLRQHLILKIDEMIGLARIGEHPQIWIKANSLSDKYLIEKLYEASNAGVHVHLLIRGIATAKPNIPNLSMNIQIRSVVGRLLEHSRVYLFKTDKDSLDMYLSSADVMPRNLDRRVELLFPILDDEIKQHIRVILHDMWHDRAQTFNKGRSGKYTHRKLKAESNPIPVQERLLIEAENRQKSAQKGEKFDTIKPITEDT